MILPVWHNISKAEVTEQSPSLAGTVARTTADFTPEEIADEIQPLLNSKPRAPSAPPTPHRDDTP